MIAACDHNGFVKPACEVIPTTGSGDNVGPINRDRFEQWVVEKLLPVLGEYALRQPRSIVVLDNATIHHSDEIVSLIESKGAIIAYLPPYSPDLNPIELMFSAYKRRFQRLHKCVLDWYTCHTLSLDAVTPDNAICYFRHSDILIHIGTSEDMGTDEKPRDEYIVLSLLFFMYTEYFL